ncbi:MAG: di-trans,poly-cis-decaprenylcistransferase [Flavobacteriaceae bacterium CG_4_8_14_3_um_filter_34_10]|nr:isoprenyl transferase [Flavobacteriia bacterium]OIP52244.1 MAG: di-trans,poly-cis-decaprenylcistransferase [Flavobacteriaceae bacterium CG2_30_34_30]PIQ19233.1 MAG: di-trans,poly-cis-decaprenylcistransferase [Flavobacteriaceae bacterium CG18_big_fil_WC_8_21_14_2_50_34_36]PIV48814.1 MAG: di-trans,poly-cis-decaprenylcistransferase [Flavobacteriaceae bacterium CG02_land_8_20_14_3_00_34_13]PIX10049.1 MAG: di-trans,poly-cis-decaprenylcistransferase [Flavobacteriaceae bacterium CG_4_8_14_3_um_filt
MNQLDQIDKNKLPKHLAVIMDGNGRWAKQKGFFRTVGHEKGANAVKELVEGCGELGIPYVTLYAFSTENWNRPKLEVKTLMNLLVSSLKKEIKTLHDNHIRLNAIGNITALPKKAFAELHEVMEKTKGYDKMVLTLALSYGSREEITNAIKDICHKVKNNIISIKNIDETVINEHLYTQNLPEVDLLIRTSGEQRISNFLLWQIAYAELYFTPVLWPDFNKDNLFEAILNYQHRERRFGKTSEQLN